MTEKWDGPTDQVRPGKKKIEQLQYSSDARESQDRFTLLDEKIFHIFVKAGEVIEVRIPKNNGHPTQSGYFDNFKDFRNAVANAIQGQQGNVYFSLQVVDPRLIGRAYNRLKTGDMTTSDGNVLFYRWIPLDLDPTRPAGISSSDTELQKAIELRDVISDFLRDATDFRFMTAVSGNGGHILIRLPEDLPVNNENKAYVKDFLENIYQNFSSDDIAVDTSVFNPSRIWKLYGTRSMKGDQIPANQYREARVHRDSYIDSLGGLENE